MNHKVLIVDDQFGIRVLLTEVLQKDGYEMFQAASGKEALLISRNRKHQHCFVGYENSRNGWCGDSKEVEGKATGYKSHYDDSLWRIKYGK